MRAYPNRVDGKEMRAQAGPFEGLKVVELSELVSGPYCTRMLGAMGADVIKVEAVGGGDRSRACGPFLSDNADPELSALFLYLNTNKKSVTLDWEATEGRGVLRRLLAQADVLVENHPTRYLQRLDLSYTDLRDINPALVMVSLSPFGSFGPYAGWETTPLVNLALGGYLFLTGEANREPLAPPGYQADYLAALHGYLGCLLALKWIAGPKARYGVRPWLTESRPRLPSVFLSEATRKVGGAVIEVAVNGFTQSNLAEAIDALGINVPLLPFR